MQQEVAPPAAGQALARAKRKLDDLQVIVDDSLDLLLSRGIISDAGGLDAVGRTMLDELRVMDTTYRQQDVSLQVIKERFPSTHDELRRTNDNGPMVELLGSYAPICDARKAMQRRLDAIRPGAELIDDGLSSATLAALISELSEKCNRPAQPLRSAAESSAAAAAISARLDDVPVCHQWLVGGNQMADALNHALFRPLSSSQAPATFFKAGLCAARASTLLHHLAETSQALRNVRTKLQDADVDAGHDKKALRLEEVDLLAQDRSLQTSTDARRAEITAICSSADFLADLTAEVAKLAETTFLILVCWARTAAEMDGLLATMPDGYDWAVVINLFREGRPQVDAIVAEVDEKYHTRSGVVVAAGPVSVWTLEDFEWSNPDRRRTQLSVLEDSIGIEEIIRQVGYEIPGLQQCVVERKLDVNTYLPIAMVLALRRHYSKLPAAPRPPTSLELSAYPMQLPFFDMVRGHIALNTFASGAEILVATPQATDNTYSIVLPPSGKLRGASAHSLAAVLQLGSARQAGRSMEAAHGPVPLDHVVEVLETLSILRSTPWADAQHSAYMSAPTHGGPLVALPFSRAAGGFARATPAARAEEARLSRGLVEGDAPQYALSDEVARATDRILVAPGMQLHVRHVPSSASGPSPVFSITHAGTGLAVVAGGAINVPGDLTM